MNNEKLQLSEKEMKDLVIVAIDEFNKISDTKIADSKKQEILNAIDSEALASINEELANIKIEDDAEAIEIVRNVLFGGYSMLALAAICVVILLIALLRFSYYK